MLVQLANTFGEAESTETAEFSRLDLPNPWRVKAAGLVIRHVPIVLYSDDASGNQSKKWNQYMSFYCTLAGLPPKLSNQEYNIHFLTSSNVASALEMAHGMVDEFK